MAKQPATHSGTCQCCGHFQKLPNGLLSKHGYSKRWGFFSGICIGAGSLPYELSCELIKGFITNAKERIKAIEKTQAHNLKFATEAKGWINEYQSEMARFGSGYVWRSAEISAEKDNGSYSYYFTNYQGKKEKLQSCYYGNDYTIKGDVLKLASAMNAKYAKSLDKDIKQLQEYIAWQNKRVKDWQLKPLVAVSDVRAEVSEAKTVRQGYRELVRSVEVAKSKLVRTLDLWRNNFYAIALPLGITGQHGSYGFEFAYDFGSPFWNCATWKGGVKKFLAYKSDSKEVPAIKEGMKPFIAEIETLSAEYERLKALKASTKN